MQLSDRDIRQMQETFGIINPFHDVQLQPATYDMRLGTPVLFNEHRADPCPDGVKTYPGTVDTINWVKQDIDGQYGFELQPLEFILGTTAEEIYVPNSVSAQINGKSSLGRIGLFVHVTAGFIDPGFKGRLTLEIFNGSNRPIQLTYLMRICQVSFTLLTSPVDRAYGDAALGSHYQNQSTVQPAAVNATGDVLIDTALGKGERK